MSQTQWFIEIEGSDRDLRRLSNLTLEEWTISMSGGIFSIAAPQFEGLADLRSVSDKGVEILLTVNGAARLYFQEFKGIRAGEPYGIRPDGVRIQYEYSVYSNIASTTTLGIDHVEPVAPGDPPSGIFGVTLALHDDPKVQRVLRCLQYDDLWTARYRLIYELIKKDVNPKKHGDALGEKGVNWVTENDHQRFWTVIHNDRGIETGDDALHVDWTDTYQAGAMTRMEAKTFVFQLVRVWLRWKYAQFGILA